MIDLSEIVDDPDLGESFTILRTTGKFVAGGWQADRPQSIDAYGVITIATGKDMSLIPQGDEVHAAISIFSTTEILLTRGSSDPIGTSDMIMWQGEKYRVLQSQNYGTRGFWHAIAARVAGN